MGTDWGWLVGQGSLAFAGLAAVVALAMVVNREVNTRTWAIASMAVAFAGLHLAITASPEAHHSPEMLRFRLENMDCKPLR